MPRPVGATISVDGGGHSRYPSDDPDAEREPVQQEDTLEFPRAGTNADRIPISLVLCEAT